jgi:hypothetical protein
MTAGRASKDHVSPGHDIWNLIGGRGWSERVIDKSDGREGRGKRA